MTAIVHRHYHERRLFLVVVRSMRTWTVLPDTRFRVYAPIGLRLVDDLTGNAPMGLRLVDRLASPARGRLAVTLLESINGELRPIDIKPTLTASAVLTYPGLGRDKTPATSASRDFEIRIDADLYRPLYRATDTGITFTAFPYHDQHPPSSVPTGPTDTRLLPGPAYPFPNHVPVLRGEVTDGGVATADVLVSSTTPVNGEDKVDRTLTDDAGQFALPIRFVEAGTPATIEARWTPPGGPIKTGSISVTIPDALSASQEIPVT